MWGCSYTRRTKEGIPALDDDIIINLGSLTCRRNGAVKERKGVFLAAGRKTIPFSRSGKKEFEERHIFGISSAGTIITQTKKGGGSHVRQALACRICTI